MATVAPSARVLVVEDEFLIRMVLAEALADEGFEVLEAGDTAEAEAILLAEPAIRLLLTDVTLPGPFDGIELARRACERRPELAVITMTGRPDPAAAPGPQRLQIAKPFTPSQVCAAAHGLLQQLT